MGKLITRQDHWVLEGCSRRGPGGRLGQSEHWALSPLHDQGGRGGGPLKDWA